MTEKGSIEAVPTKAERLFDKLSSLPWTFLLFYFTVITAFLITTDSWDVNDLYWHTRMGQDILDSNRLTGDPSWTFGPVGDSTWRTTQAVAETLMYRWHQLFGWQGFLAVRIIAIAVFSATVFYTIRYASPRGKNLSRTKVAFLVASPIIFMYATLIQERPQTLSFLLALPLGIVLLRVLELNRWPHPATVFIVVMVWGWVHGSAIFVGPLLILAYGIRMFYIHLAKFPLSTAGYDNAGTWRWFLVIIAAFLAPLVNPLGADIYTRAFLIRDASSEFISEWKSFDIDSLSGIIAGILLAFWAVSVGMKLWRRESWRIIVLEATWIGLLLVAGITSIRIFMFFFLIISPILARRLTQAWRNKPVTLPVVHGRTFWDYIARSPKPLVFLILIVFTLTVPFAWAENTGLPKETPVTIISGISQEENRQVFSDWNLTGITQLFGGESISTFVDGRTDRYGKEILEQYKDIYYAKPGWLDTWSKYNVTDVIVKDDAALADRLKSEGWRLACEDNGYVWYIKAGLPGECSDIPVRTTGLN